MSTSYTSAVTWQGGHRGELRTSNGVVCPFSAPPGLHGESGVLTPEDALVGALNTCYALMFIWAAERLRLNLIAYTCETEGYIEQRVDQTSEFSRFVVRPKITVSAAGAARARRALDMARKYSLVAESLKGAVTVEPEIVVSE